MASLDNILTYTVRNLSAPQLERAAEVFIFAGSSFAVSQGELWLSETSLKFFELRNEYILHGENGPQ